MEPQPQTFDFTKLIEYISATPFLLPLAIGGVIVFVLCLTIVFMRASKKKKMDANLTSAVKELAQHDKEVEKLNKKKTEKKPEPAPQTAPATKVSWQDKLKSRLTKTNQAMFGGLSSIFSKGKIDEDSLDEMYEKLYRADIGVKVADRLVDAVKKQINNKETKNWLSIREILKAEIESIFNENPAPPINENPNGPQVILVVGVNGAGKTTSTGKLAANYKAEGKSVLLAAADTFRAAAIDQLKTWGERIEVDVVAQQPGADPAAVAYDGVKAAVSRKSDVLLVDTAGRLHNKKDLMEELAKVRRVLSKDVAEAPHETWLVVDGTTGQNANMQVKAFSEVAPLTGVIVTKLDGTAKGGVLISIAMDHKIPIRYIGIGEKAEDLKPFDAVEYVEAIFQETT